MKENVVVLRDMPTASFIGGNLTTSDWTVREPIIESRKGAAA